MKSLEGIYAPITTPFDENGGLALGGLEANLRRWIGESLDGVVMPGSNSEAAYLSAEERNELWRCCGRVLKGSGTRFISGTGMETTAETIEMTQRAAEAGAEASLVIPPHFYRAAMSHDTLLAHYSAVANESPIPILVYNVPAFTGISFQPETLFALAEHPRIVGVKDSSSNVVNMARVLAARPEFQVFAGTGSALLPFLSLGAVGGIMALANFASPRLRELLDAFNAGRKDRARQIQLSVAEINTAVTARFGVPGLKYAMDRSGFYGGPCRLPLLPLKKQARDEIDTLLAAL